MVEMKLRYQKLAAHARVPLYATAGAACFDISACLTQGVQKIRIKPGKRVLVPTGLIFEIPEGYELQLRPRSGLALKEGLTLLNSPGTIDSDYRGEVKLILINLGDVPIVIEDGQRLAQCKLAIAMRPALLEAESIDAGASARAASGFGSTGKGEHIR